MATVWKRKLPSGLICWRATYIDGAGNDAPSNSRERATARLGFFKHATTLCAACTPPAVFPPR